MPGGKAGGGAKAKLSTKDKDKQVPSVASYLRKRNDSQSSGSVNEAHGREKAGAKQKWQQSCGDLLSKLMAADEDGFFLAPVDPVELDIPDYFEVVTKPMDLGTVQERLRAGEYAAAQAFAEDVRLVFSNAMRYNEEPDHIVHAAACRLLRSFDTNYGATFPAPRSDSPDQACTGRGADNGVSDGSIQKARRSLRSASARTTGDSKASEESADGASGKGRQVAGGGKRTKEKESRVLTDYELLTFDDFFLNQEQRKRKERLLREQKFEADKQRRKEDIEAINRGKTLHPFFSGRAKATEQDAVVDGTCLDEDGKGGDAVPWSLPPFPDMPHVTQQEQCGVSGVHVNAGGETEGRPRWRDSVSSHAQPCQLTNLTEHEDDSKVVDLEAEEAAVRALRGVMVKQSVWSVSPNQTQEFAVPRPSFCGSSSELTAKSPEDVVQELAREAGVAEDRAKGHVEQLSGCTKGDQACCEALWVDKYRPRQTYMLMQGAQFDVAHALETWLEEWERMRHSEDDSCSTPPKQRKARLRRKNQDNSDDDWIGEDAEYRPRDEVVTTASTRLILGPTGCGKTALVYAVAEKKHFRVIEVNTSQTRSGAEIKKLFSEATQSQHLSRSRRADSATFVDADDETEELLVLEAQDGPRRMVLMLIEEVDLVFEDKDSGFHRVLRDLMASAKVPLVMTANKSPGFLRDGDNCAIHRLERPPTSRLALLLATVWAAERLAVALPPGVFRQLAKLAAGDVRSAIMTLQLWADRLSRLCEQQQCQQQHEEQDAQAESLLESQSVAERPPSLLGYRFPVVHKVTPHGGPIVGGTVIRVLGHSFLQLCADGAPGWATVQVFLGQHECSRMSVESDTELVVVSPAAPHGRPQIVRVVVKLCNVVSSQAGGDGNAGAVFRYRSPQAQPRIDEVYFPLGIVRKRGRGRTPGGSDVDEAPRAADELAAARGPEADDMGKKRRLRSTGDDDEGAKGGLRQGQGQGRNHQSLEGIVDEMSSSESDTDTTDRDGADPWAAVEAQGQEDVAVKNQNVAQAQEDAVLVQDDHRQLESVVEARMEETLEVDSREYRVAFRPSWTADRRPSEEACRAEVDALATCADALSTCWTLEVAEAPQLDGDVFVTQPCSSMLKPGLRPEDTEVSCWPAVGGLSERGAVAGVMLDLVRLRCAERPSTQRLVCDHGGGAAYVDTEHIRSHHQALMVNTVASLLSNLSWLRAASSALEYCPTLRRIHLYDQANSVRDTGRRRNRHKSYIGSLDLDTEAAAALNELLDAGAGLQPCA